MAQRQDIDFWERGMACTVKLNTLKNVRTLYGNEIEKNEKIKLQKTPKDKYHSVKEMKASASAALIKAKAEHAAFLVKASFMERQHELEAKQRAIKRRLEELELETKIAEVTAKLAVLNASRKSKSAKSRTAQDKPQIAAPKPQTKDSEDCPFARIFLVEKDETGEGLDEVDWEGPEIFVPVFAACEQTGAGDTAEIQPALSVPPDCAVHVTAEPHQNIQVPGVDTEDPFTELDSDRGTHVDHPPAQLVASGSKDKEPVKNIVSVPVEEDIHGAVSKRLLQELVSSGPQTDTLPTGVYIKKDSTAVIVLPSQVLGELTLFDCVSMNSRSYGNLLLLNVALMTCILFLLVVQSHKLFQIKRYKAFKRKRWK